MEQYSVIGNISLDKGRRGNSSFIYNVDAIERAINENKQISFLYFNYDEKHKKVYRKNGNRYTVSPAFILMLPDCKDSIGRSQNTNSNMKMALRRKSKWFLTNALIIFSYRDIRKFSVVVAVARTFLLK